MNATQNLLMLMQQMSSAMSLPAVNTKTNQSNVSFEDMLNKASSAAPKDKVPVKDGQSADAAEKPEVPKDGANADQAVENGEEKTAYQMVGSAVNPYAALVQPDVQMAEDETITWDPQAMTQVQSAPLEEDVPAEASEPQLVEGSFQLPEETLAEEAVEEAPIAPEAAEKTVEAQPELEIREVKTERQEAPAEDADDTRIEGYEAESAEKPLFKDAEAAPVKVGERYEVDTESSDMDSQLASSIRQAMNAAVEKIEIRLAPEHLGAVTIEMGRDASGALQVVLHTATGKAASLLTEHLDSLHAALQNMGHDTVHVEVQRSEESAQQQSMHQQADPDSHNQQHYQQQRRQQQAEHPEDFLQQLRLGLFSLDDVI